jgi:hypothetical protein
MAIPKLFTLVNGELVINKIELLTITPFRNIARKDREIAFKEFAYIYHVADPRSLANIKGESEKDAHVTATSLVGLDTDWKPSQDVTNAIMYYRTEMTHVGSDVVLELLKTFKYNKDVIEQVRRSIGDTLSKGKLSKDQAAEILGLIQTTIKLARDIPGLVRDLNKAISEFSKNIEEDSVPFLRGTNDRVPQSMDFDNDLR